MPRLYRALSLLFCLLPLVACTGGLVAKRGDGEAIHGGDTLDLALRATRLRFLQAAKGLRDGQKLALLGERPPACEALYGASLCAALEAGAGVEYAKQYLKRNAPSFVALLESESLSFLLTSERKFQPNGDGSQREVLAWAVKSESGSKVFFNQQSRHLSASSLLALAVHEVGHLIVDDSIGRAPLDADEFGAFGDGRWLLDTAGALLSIYAGQSSAETAAQLPPLSDRNLMALLFDGPTGARAVQDVSGNGNQVSCQEESACEGAGAAGVIGASHRFNGGREFLKAAPNSGLQPERGDFSVSIWIYPTEHRAFVRVLHKVTAFMPNDEGYYIGLKQGRAAWHLGDGTKAVDILDARVLSLNAWHHVAGTWNAATSTGTLYVDGVAVESKSADLPLVSPRGDLLLGGRVGFPDESFVGNLDETGLWSRVLSAAEVERIFLDRASLSSR